MKRRYLLLFFPIILSLSSCLKMENLTPKTKDKKVTMYSLTGEVLTSDIETYKVKEYDFKVIEEEEEVLYTTLSTFASLFENRAIDGYNFAATNNALTISNSLGKYIFVMDVNTMNEIITIAGSISSALIDERDYSKSSMMLGLQNEEEVVKEGEVYAEYSFHNIGFNYFYLGGTLYLPLSLLDLTTGDKSNLYYHYDYQYLYQLDDASLLSNKIFDFNGESSSITNKEKSYIIANLENKMPSYIAKERRANLYFLMMNLYGLKQQKNIEDMKAYLDNLVNIDDLENEDISTNQKALQNIIANLNDGHTAFSSFGPWVSENTANVSYGPLWTERMSLLAHLTLMRSQSYVKHEKKTGEYLLSSDGTLAFLPFNHFSFVMDAYNKDGSINPIIYKNDDFFFLYKSLQSIKELGTVKDVVLDMSLNTGGTIGVLYKILTLLNKENSSYIYFRDSIAGTVFSSITKIDSNLDQKYDKEDVFGDDFNFYILTSPVSFSCGNALPFLAKAQGFAKIIGVKSGGGECTVRNHILSTGEVLNHSASLHIGYYDDTNGFMGDEMGAAVDKGLTYDYFYDPDILRGLLPNE